MLWSVRPHSAPLPVRQVWVAMVAATAHRRRRRAGLRGIIALPASRLDGFYYALLTLGLNELCRVYFTTSPVFGAANGGLFGAATFIPEDSQIAQSLISYYACFAGAAGALPLRFGEWTA